MIAIRNSTLFVLIALLLSVATLAYSIGFLEVLGIIAMGVTIVVGITQMVKWAIDALKTKKQQLESMEKDLKKNKEKGRQNTKKYNELNKSIARCVKLVKDSETLKDNAWDAYQQSVSAYNTAVSNEAAKRKASENASSDYTRHVLNSNLCSRSCQMTGPDYRCSSGVSLYDLKTQAAEALRTAKVAVSDAKTAKTKAATYWFERLRHLNNYKNSLRNHRKNRTNLISAHASLLKERKTLEENIAAKKQEIVDAEADLEMLKKAKDEAPGYIQLLNEAYENGTMNQDWLDANPPPENFQRYLEEYYEPSP